MKKRTIIFLIILGVIIVAFAGRSVVSNFQKDKIEAKPFPTLEFATMYDFNELKAESEYIGKKYYITATVREIHNNTVTLTYVQKELPCGLVYVKLPLSQSDEKAREVAENFGINKTVTFEGVLTDDSYVSRRKSSNFFGNIGKVSGILCFRDVVFYENEN